ncbi:Uncharacterized protein QTN25_003046 [Entamoeba marina]
MRRVPTHLPNPSKDLLRSDVDYTETLTALYNKTTHLTTSAPEMPIIRKQPNELMDLLCIDGMLHFPVNAVPSGLLSNRKAGDSIYICATINSALQVLNPFITQRPFQLNTSNIWDVNELIFAAMALDLPSEEISEKTGLWLLQHQQERLDAVAETWVINSLLSHKKELAYNLRDYLAVARNTQNVFSSMLLGDQLNDVACSPENMGVIAGYCAENAMREGGKWFKELQKLFVAGTRNKEYVSPLFVVGWRICMEDRCQKEFIQSGCLKELLVMIKDNEKEDIALTFIEIMVSLLQNEDIIDMVDNAQAIEILIDLMKKNMSLKIIQSAALRAFSLFCGIEQNNQKMLRNHWIDVIKNIMTLYRTDSTIQNVGLNIIVKLLPTPESRIAFQQLELSSYIKSLLQLHSNSPSVLILCFQILKDLSGKDLILIETFPTILNISHSFENDWSIISGCLYVFSLIFGLEESIQLKTKEHIKWIMELCLRYIEIEDVFLSAEKILLTLSINSTCNLIKENGCVVVASSLLQHANTIEQKKDAILIIKKMLQCRVDAQLLGSDTFSIIVNEMNLLEDVEICTNGLQCICLYNKTLSFDQTDETYIELLNEWVNSSVKVTQKYNDSRAAECCVYLMKYYIQTTQQFDKFELDCWGNVLTDLIRQNPYNELLIEEILSLRVTSQQIATVFTEDQIIEILPLIRYHIENTTHNSLLNNSITCGILFVCPYRNQIQKIVQAMFDSGFYHSCIQKTQSTTLKQQFEKVVFQALMISHSFVNKYSTFDLFTSNIWEIYNSSITNTKIQNLFKSNVSPQQFCHELKQMTSDLSLVSGIYGLFSLSNRYNDFIKDNLQFINECLQSKNSIATKRNAMTVYAVINQDCLKKEESLIKNGINSILSILNDENCLEDFIFVGLCSLYNLCGINTYRKLLNEQKNKDILNRLLLKSVDNQQIINHIIKCLKDGHNKTNFHVH